MARLETLAEPPRIIWQETEASAVSGRRRFSLLVSGSIVMLAGSGLVSLINFVFNVAMARMLGPAEFASVTAAVTLLMLFSAVTLSFQLVGAKFIALNETDGQKAGVYRQLMRRAWWVSALLGAGLVLSSGAVARYLRISDPWQLVVLAVGIAFYMPLGVKRGTLQGLCAFPRLTLNFLLEAAVRLLAAVALVALGYGVRGAVGAISMSVFLAFAFSFASPRAPAAKPFIRASFREGMQAIVFFVGQVVINNIDIIMVKHFFAATDAGMYAAVALVGRVLYFAAWSVVSAMFPISAAAKTEEEKSRVLGVPLLVVSLISAIFIAVMTFFPAPIIHVIFGSGFRQAEPLLCLYAATTALYALSVVLMTYEMSRKIANTGWLQLATSVVMVIGISLFHRSLHQVIVVQLLLMILLLGLVSIPFLRIAKNPARFQEAL